MTFGSGGIATRSAPRPHPQEATHARALDGHTQLAYDGLSMEYIEAPLFTRFLPQYLTD